MEYNERFFDWLRSQGMLDLWEALLDTIEDFTNQELNLRAREDIYKIEKLYGQTS